MKQTLKLGSFIAASALLFTASTVYAAANLGLTGSGTRTVGTPFTINISENSGAQEVNAVDATITYNPDQLQVTNVTAGDFSNCFVAGKSSDKTVTFQCSILGGKLTGAHSVGNITFKPLTGGSANVNVSGAVLDANTNASTNSAASATYTLITPAPGQGGSSLVTPGTSTPKASVAPAAGKTSPSATPAVAGVSATQSPAAAATNEKAGSTIKTIDYTNVKSGTAAWSFAGILVLLVGGAALYFAQRGRLTFGKAKKA